MVDGPSSQTEGESPNLEQILPVSEGLVAKLATVPGTRAQLKKFLIPPNQQGWLAEARGVGVSAELRDKYRAELERWQGAQEPLWRLRAHASSRFPDESQRAEQFFHFLKDFLPQICYLDPYLDSQKPDSDAWHCNLHLLIDYCQQRFDSLAAQFLAYKAGQFGLTLGADQETLEKDKEIAKLREELIKLKLANKVLEARASITPEELAALKDKLAGLEVLNKALELAGAKKEAAIAEAVKEVKQKDQVEIDRLQRELQEAKEKLSQQGAEISPEQLAELEKELEALGPLENLLETWGADLTTLASSIRQNQDRGLKEVLLRAFLRRLETRGEFDDEKIEELAETLELEELGFENLYLVAREIAREKPAALDSFLETTQGETAFFMASKIALIGPGSPGPFIIDTAEELSQFQPDNINLQIEMRKALVDQLVATRREDPFNWKRNTILVLDDAKNFIQTHPEVNTEQIADLIKSVVGNTTDISVAMGTVEFFELEDVISSQVHGLVWDGVIGLSFKDLSGGRPKMILNQIKNIKGEKSRAMLLTKLMESLGGNATAFSKDDKSWQKYLKLLSEIRREHENYFPTALTEAGVGLYKQLKYWRRKGETIRIDRLKIQLKELLNIYPNVKNLILLDIADQPFIEEEDVDFLTRELGLKTGK